MQPPRKRHSKKKPTRSAKEMEQLRKTGWRCGVCYDWHPSVEARNNCVHARIGLGGF